MWGWNESMWFAIFAGVALKSTAVLGVAWLTALLLRGRSAAARHLVWTGAAAALLALPFLSVSLPGLPVPGAGALPGAGVVFQTTATTRADAAASQAPRRKGAPGRAQPTQWRRDWRLWLMLSWAAGVAAAFTHMLAACAGIWRMRRAATPSPDRHLSGELALELGIPHAVEVLETSEGAMPMTFGIVRPAVFLPRDAAEWSQERRRIVLLHELAHVLRGDAATQLLARLALILNWWNPLAWAAWREFLKEREHAADDLVLQAGARPSEYASHLLEVARTRQAAPAPGWAAVAMARRSPLEGRLRAILDTRANRNTAGRASALAAAVVAVAIVAPLAAVRAQDGASQSIPPDLDATMRAAAAQKNHEMLEKAASAFEASLQYDTARELLDSAAAIRAEVAGKQSVDYGVGLMKLGDLEKRRRRHAEAEAFYNKAALVLGDRPEAAPALMYLGVTMLEKKSFGQAIEDFQQAQRLDLTQAGPAMMWMALVREREQNPAEAEAMYKSAMAVEKADSADAANTMELYARFLRQQGRDEEARAIEERAAAARKALSRQDRAQLQSSANVLRVGGAVTPPKVSSKSEPEYTEEARVAKYQGTAVLYLEIDPDGTARNIRVLKGLGFGLDESAVAAVSRWRFQPGTKDGAAVTVAAHIEVNFRLL